MKLHRYRSVFVLAPWHFLFMVLSPQLVCELLGMEIIFKRCLYSQHLAFGSVQLLSHV